MKQTPYSEDVIPDGPLGSYEDAIPVDPSGFDVDAWMARLEAELSQVPSTAERIERVISLRVGMARLAAQEARELAALADGVEVAKTTGSMAGTSDLEYRSLVAELAVALRVSDRTMASRLDEATTLAVAMWDHLTQQGSTSVPRLPL